MTDEPIQPLPCVHCGKPSTHLCDYVIGQEEIGREWCKGTLRNPQPHWFRYTGGDARSFTCDRPLCESCLTNEGQWFYDGGTLDFESGGPVHSESAIVSIDRCRDHAGKPDSHAVITEQEADDMRRAMERDAERRRTLRIHAG